MAVFPAGGGKKRIKTTLMIIKQFPINTYCERSKEEK